jgi:FtsP/CotA-like multicopper oxidase with cupredoxin domain
VTRDAPEEMTMREELSRNLRWTAAARWGGALVLAVLLAGARPAAAALVGVACTSGPNFTLTTRVGYIQLPDGNTMYMWGFAEPGKDFQHPGPVLCVNEGDVVTVTLQNGLPDPVSIIFPGQDGVTVDGSPSQPQFDGNGKLTSLANAAPPISGGTPGSVTYTFVASKPGTFLYESGVNPQTQVRMGLFGALVVRPALGAAYAYNRADSRFTPTEEFLVLLSEIDPYQHQAAESGVPFNITTYHPRYWLLNGRGFPDSIADNFADWLPNQPYGGLARVYPMDPTTHPYPGLIRYLNVGTENYPYHPHGNNGLVVGRDGNPLVGAGGQDLSFEKFAINIGPGQAWDVTFSWRDAEGYSDPAKSSTPNPVPVTIPSPANLEYGMFYGGSPYLGSTGPLLPGKNTLNQCGEFYIISHNHALYQITSWGMTMSGPITYLRVDPPLPNTCP